MPEKSDNNAPEEHRAACKGPAVNGRQYLEIVFEEINISLWELILFWLIVKGERYLLAFCYVFS